MDLSSQKVQKEKMFPIIPTSIIAKLPAAFFAVMVIIDNFIPNILIIVTPLSVRAFGSRQLRPDRPKLPKIL